MPIIRWNILTILKFKKEGKKKMSIKIALAGNPNSGKTTLFNGLTGSNQFVGNWPGVTVEKKEGKLKGHKDVTITDLPGIYSLSPYTLEEVVARNYLINEKPDVILNIVDGTNIERNLYLSTQLMELGIPVVMAVNMIDIMEKSGDKISIKDLKESLGCEVVEISALKGKGIKEAANKAVELAKKPNHEMVHKFDKKVEDAIEKVEEKIAFDIPKEQQRFFAIKLLERDDKIKGQMKTVPDVENEIKQLEDAFDDDTESIITNERYTYISSVIGKCVSKGNKGELTTSDKIDKIVTNRWLALPIFAVVMFIVYYVSVTTVGTWATDWANEGVFGDGWHLFGIGTSSYEDASGDYEKQTAAVDAFIEAAKDKGISTDNIEEVLGNEEASEADKTAAVDAFVAEAGVSDITAKAELEDEKQKAEDLIKRIEEAIGSTETDNTDKVKDITSENVETKDKSDLEKAKDELEKALDDYKDNLTDDEKKDIQDEIDRIEKALEVIDKVEKVEDLINKLPENISKSDADAIKKADEAYNALSKYEQSILDKNAKKKLDNAKSALETLNSPATGDNGKIWMWFALLFVSGGGLLGTTAYRRKRKETEN